MMTSSQKLKGYKYRIYPDDEQKLFLSKTFGCTRFYWNKLVSEFNSYVKIGPSLKPVRLKDLRKEHSWLKELSFDCVDSARICFQETKKQFFNKSRKSKVGRPQFKSKHKTRDKFTIPMARLFKLDQINKTLKITKLKTPIKLTLDREISGEIRSCTISRNPSGQYFASILVKEEIQPKKKTGKQIGIDLGLKDFFILSDGTKAKNPRYYKRSEKKLAASQRHLSRKTKGHNRYRKQRIKVARIHQKVEDGRHHFTHQLSTWLVNNYDVIVTEDLEVSNMVKNSRLAKSISDVGWSEFIRQLSYKADWYGKAFHKVDRWYPSTQICNDCDLKSEIKITLDVREWKCFGCGIVHDRDENAAKNILNRGLKDLNIDSATCVENIRGESVRLTNDFVREQFSAKRRDLCEVAS